MKKVLINESRKADPAKGEKLKQSPSEWKCEKCSAILYNVVGKLGKCPVCGHYYEPTLYRKTECDCKYCKEGRR